MAADEAYVRRAGPGTLWRGGRPVLTALDIELTERCDNRCVHCCINQPEHDREVRSRELSTERVVGVLDEAAALGVLGVRFTGGEILLREDLQQIYLHARRLGMRVTLMTNARKLTPEFAALLARVPPREPLEITAYGMRAESYAAVSRVAGAFDEFRRGLKLLDDYHVPYVVKGTLLPPTIGEMAELETWAATLPVARERAGFIYWLDLRLRRDDEAASRRIASLRLSPEEGVAVLARDPRAAAALRAEAVVQCTEPSDLLFTCGIGGRPCLDAYGMLQPCLTLRAPQVVYDLAHGSLREAITEFFPGLRELRAGDPEYLRRCARCFLAGVCDQCPSKSWAEHGTLDTPVDYFCEVTQARARFIGLLQDGELPWDVIDGKERVKWLME
jgi:radical SAM protein with 4Fe4S-binding SPASM domain